MGRKLVGLSLGFLLTIVLSFYLFPVEYDGLISWLAPFFGPWLRFAFMFLFIIFADPLAYTNVLMIWAIAGLISGLFVRSIWGSIPVAIGIFLLSFIMMIVGFVAMLVPFLTGGMAGFDFMALLGTMPPGVALDIFSAPVLGPIIQSLMGGLGEALPGMGAGLDITSITAVIQDAILRVIFQAIINFVILVVATAIGGVIGRVIRRPED
ncbi:MAG: hypothetical protein ACFFDP_03950 [Promethearchaeota archaeon]